MEIKNVVMASVSYLSNKGTAAMLEMLTNDGDLRKRFEASCNNAITDPECVRTSGNISYSRAQGEQIVIEHESLRWI